MAKFGGGEDYVSIESQAKELFLAASMTQPAKWEDQSQIVKDVWIRRAIIGVPAEQKPLNVMVHISAYISGPGAAELDWYDLLAPSEGNDYQITKCDIKMYYSQNNNEVK